MPSGQDRVIINNLERAISGDINTLQDFEATSRQGLLRRLFSRASPGRRQYQNPGLDAAPTALPTSDYGTVHDCYGGLMVRPDNAAGLLIDPGAAGFLVPGWTGLAAGQTPYIVVDSDGVSDVSLLPFVANASGSPRIDIVECQPFEDVTTTVSQSRDVLNPSTDNWVPTVVPKYAGAQLAFRVRQGTAGAGFPAVDQAWMPLAFIVIQSGSAGFNQSDVYDVRPLVSERANQYGSAAVATTAGGIPTSSGEVYDRGIQLTNLTGQVTGWFRGEFAGYEIGGTVQRNTPSALADFGAAGDAAYFDTTIAANTAQGSNAPSTVLGDLSAIVAVFPRGLGRCVRYSQAAVASAAWTGQQSVAGRLPNGPNGILVVARSPVTTPKGGVLLVDLPAVFGASVSGSYPFMGVVVGWVQGTGSICLALQSRGKRHEFVNTLALNSGTDKDWTSSGSLPYSQSVLGLVLSPNGNMTLLGRAANASLIPNTARSVTIKSTIAISVSGAVTTYQPVLTAPEASWSTLASSTTPCRGGQGHYFGLISAASVAPLEETFEVPLTKDSPWVGGGIATTVERTLYANGGTTIDAESNLAWNVTGWDEW